MTGARDAASLAPKLTLLESGDERARELLERLDAVTDGERMTSRNRDLDGDIHRFLTGLRTCAETLGTESRCRHGWPAECQSRLDHHGDYPHGTYRCGIGRIGGWLPDRTWVGSAPRYTADIEGTRAALLKALSSERGDGVSPLKRHARETTEDQS